MVNFMLNGEVVSAESDSDTPLLWVLREDLSCAARNLVAALPSAVHALFILTEAPCAPV